MTFDPYDVEVGKRLRKARQAAGITREAIAERFDISVSTVQMHETGRNGFSGRLAAQYSRAYQVRVGWLLQGSGDMKEDKSGEVIDLLQRMESDEDREAWLSIGRRLADPDE